MFIEYYVVYEVTDEATSARDEVRRFRKSELAVAWAEAYATGNGVSTTIDRVVWDVTRHGREVVESDADLYAFDGRGESTVAKSETQEPAPAHDSASAEALDELDVVDQDGELEPEEDSASVEARMASIKERLGITEPVEPIRRQVVPLDCLLVPGADLVRRHAAGIARNLELVGMMHQPAVLDVDLSDLGEGVLASPERPFPTIAGRRRILAAIRRGDEAIEVSVYARDLTKDQQALITLSENHTRGEAWVRDVESIAQLRNGAARLTIDDLALMLGRTRSGVAELVRIASLPETLLALVLDGKLTQLSARQLTRLKTAELDRLAALAAGDEPLDPDTIRDALRGQWDDMAPHLGGLLRPTENEDGADADDGSKGWTAWKPGDELPIPWASQSQAPTSEEGAKPKGRAKKSVAPDASQGAALTYAVLQGLATADKLPPHLRAMASELLSELQGL